MTARASREIRLAPVEGWISLGLVLVLALCLAWSIDGAGWVLGKSSLTAFLPYAAAGGVAWGFISAKVGWPRWLAQLLGIVFAALLLPIMVGGLLPNSSFVPGQAFVATASSSVEAYLDLAFRGLAFTQQYGHFMLVLGIICWGTGQFASYAVFGHHRPLNAVIISGVALVINMSLTRADQLGILIWFSLAALFLLIRLHALDEKSTWLRHRLGETGSLSGTYLRAGSAFIGVAVVGALLLTTTASSAPLAGIGRGLDERLVEWTQVLERVFRGGGLGTRFSPVDFLDSTRITGVWITDPTPVLAIKVPDAGRYYWRAVAYDHFDGQNWSVSKGQDTGVAAGSPLLTGTLDDPGKEAARRLVTFDVRELNFDPETIFTPDAPVKVSTDTTVSVLGTSPEESVARVVKSSATEYQVTAEVPPDVTKDPLHGLTGNQLNVAGTTYPAGISQYFLQLDPVVAHGPNTVKLLAAILAAHPAARTPYQQAVAVRDYLLNEGGFTYLADVSGVNCGNDGVVECFATNKVGYCQYYASTMVVLMRMLGVPTRLAEGFLPSTPDANGIELIRKSAAHAWVEVYFPGYGWIDFDPTGGGVGLDTSLPAGVVVTPRPTVAPTPGGSPDSSGRDRRPSPRDFDTNTTAAGPTNGAGPGNGFVLIGLLLLGIMGVLVLLAWRRGPRQPQEPDRVYGGVVGLARRFGFGPRANQTVYEYAAGLGDILPAARSDLLTVAVAKVEVAYGRRTLGPSRMDALRLAQRHLRFALLRLVFRRSERRAQRRRRG
jgi:transglutaminase-like putative cysteine protease